MMQTNNSERDGSPVTSQINIREYAAAIADRWLMISVLLVATILGVMVANYLIRPSFIGAAKVLVERTKAEEIPYYSQELMTFNKLQITQTQTEIVKSAPILEQAIRKLDLDKRKKPDNLRERFYSMVDAVRKALMNVYVGVKRFAVVKIFGGKFKEPGEPDPFRVALDSLKQEKTIRVEPIEDTDIFVIYVSDYDPEMAALIANTVADVYVKETTRVKEQKAQSAGTFVDGQLAVIEPELRKAEEMFDTFKEQNNIVLLDDQLKTKIANLAELERSYFELLREFESSTAKFESELNGVKEKYGPKHPETLKLEAEVSKMRRKLALYSAGADAKTSSNVALPKQDDPELAEYSKLIGKINEHKREIEDMSNRKLQFERMSRDLEVKEKVYKDLLEKKADAQLAQLSQLTDVRIIERALVPTKLSKPKKLLNLGAGVAASLSLGLGLALLLEYLNHVLRKAGDVVSHGVGPLLGTIPLRRRRKVGLLKQDSKDSLSEAYRNIGNCLKLASPNGEAMSVAVLSAARGEGRSLTLANLGVTLATDERKVALVDADLWNPHLHEIFGVSNQRGLSSVLKGETDLDATLVKTSTPNLFLLPAGPSVENPGSLLESSAFKETLSSLKSRFKVVLVDSAPLLERADALCLSKLADGNVLVYESNRTTLETATRLQQLLKALEVEPWGVVLNKCRG